MDDKELLELAAKAAGIEIYWVNGDPHMVFERWSGNPAEDPQQDSQPWNPLTDDGDALRLAVKFHLDIIFYWDGCEDQYDIVEAYTHGAGKDAQEQIGFLGTYQFDDYEGTRRAIVRAAAEIGKSMP